MNPVALFLISVILIGSWFWYRRQPPELRRKAAIRIVILTLTLALLYLTVTGKLHWIGGIFALLLPFLQKLIPWVLRLSPLYRIWKQRKSGDSPQNRAKASPNLSRVEALEVLGLKEGASRDDIIQAHRKLIQKLHPDRGGNDWLAAKINAAKDRLLE